MSLSVSPLIGRPAWEVIAHIARGTRYSQMAMSFTQLALPGVQLVDKEEKTAVGSTMWATWEWIVREAERVPESRIPDFWSRLAGHQTDPATDPTEVPFEEVPNWLELMVATAGRSEAKAWLVNSRCRPTSVGSHNQESMHIPMMDFRCPLGRRYIEHVRVGVRQLGQRAGVIVESGRSYHYYGFELLTENEWQDFMHRALLLAPFTDARYVGHRLLSGTGRLRITATATRPKEPLVVAVL